MAAKQGWLHTARLWIKARRLQEDIPLGTQDSASSDASEAPGSGDASDTVVAEEMVGIATSTEAVEDSTPDFETFVEDPNALSAESKLLLDDLGPDEGNEGAAALIREQEGDPLDQVGDGVPGAGIPEPDGLRVEDLERGFQGPKGDALDGFDPDSLVDPRLADSEGIGHEIGELVLQLGAAHQSLGIDDTTDMQAVGDLIAGDFVGDDTESRLARAQAHQEAGSTPDPADQEAANTEAEKVPSNGGDPPSSDPPSSSESGSTEGGGTETPGDRLAGAIGLAPPVDPAITPDPEGPGPPMVGGEPPQVLGLPLALEKTEPLTSLIQPPADEEARAGRVAAELDPSLEARQQGFTDPAPDDEGGWDDPFGLSEVDTLLDPPDMLGGGVLGGVESIDLSDADLLGDGPTVEDGTDDWTMDGLDS